jgi:hypothetical protein
MHKVMKASALVAALVVGAGCASYRLPTGDDFSIPDSLGDFGGVAVLRVGGCNLDGPVHVMANRQGNRYDVWFNDPLPADLFAPCGYVRGVYVPIVFEGEVTARAADGRLEIEASTGPQTPGGRFLLTVTPIEPELQAQLSAGEPLVERNRVTVGVQGDRELRLHVAIATP